VFGWSCDGPKRIPDAGSVGRHRLWRKIGSVKKKIQVGIARVAGSGGDQNQRDFIFPITEGKLEEDIRGKVLFMEEYQKIGRIALKREGIPSE